MAFELFGNSYVIAGDLKAIRVRRGMWGDGQRPLESEQPERLQQLVDLYRSWARAKGVLPVQENWSPWYGDLQQLPPPTDARPGAAQP